jgi:hypothetical protein
LGDDLSMLHVFKKKMNIDIEETPSVDDPTRHELLWSTRQEDLCENWVKDSTIRSQKHGAKAKAFKCKYHLFGLLNLFLPLMLATATPFIGEYHMMYQALLFVVSLNAAIISFFKLETSYARHNEYENKFLEFVDDIQSELARPKRHRLACDVFVERAKNQHNKLISSSPDL